MIKEAFFETREALFGELTKRCSTVLSEALLRNNQASFIVSGGSTPEPLFNALSELDLAWSSIDIALVDERWVDTDHDKSNQRFIKNSLLKKYGADARFIGMKTNHTAAAQAQSSVNTDYQKIAQPFDIVLLGMGVDGHTASLFPNSDTIEQTLSLENPELCSAVMAKKSAVTGDIVERMSLTLTGITNAKQIILLITGENKLSVYQQARTTASINDIPVGAVLQQQRCPVNVYWAP